MRESFDKYLLNLRRAYADGGTEHSGRAALEALLKGIHQPLAQTAMRLC